eukprot:SAG31_NODE_9791_length_1226_cov_1.709849_1_plen_351_part_01
MPLGSPAAFRLERCHRQLHPSAMYAQQHPLHAERRGHSCGCNHASRLAKSDGHACDAHGVGASTASTPALATQRKPRARDLGCPFTGTPGDLNSIVDVRGVAVGHCTLIYGEGPTAVRTGVTAVRPRGTNSSTERCFAGVHSFNGCGELTGFLWVDESGIATGPYMLTGTGSVGVVHNATMKWCNMDGNPKGDGLPIVAETYDGRLSASLHDSLLQPIGEEHVFAALNTASESASSEGCVGGGTGMITHGFKAGIGTSSRLVNVGLHGKYTIGVLVQSNYGERSDLRIAGVPVGRELADVLPPTKETPSPPTGSHTEGSIVVFVATDAPLLPDQLRRLARRPALGLGRLGS